MYFVQLINMQAIGEDTGSRFITNLGIHRGSGLSTALYSIFNMGDIHTTDGGHQFIILILERILFYHISIR